MNWKKWLFSISASIVAICSSLIAISCGYQTKGISFIISSDNYNFMYKIENGAQSITGTNIKFSSAENNQGNEEQLVKSKLDDGTQALVVNLVDPKFSQEIINLAKDKSVPLVLINKEINNYMIAKVMQSYNKLYYVGTSAQQVGELQAQLIYQDLKDGIIKDKNGDGKIDYVFLAQQEEDSDTILRSKFLRNKLYELIKKDGVNPSKVKVGNMTIDNKTKSFDIKKELDTNDIKELFNDHSLTPGVATFVSQFNEHAWSTASGEKALNAIDAKKIRLDFIASNNDTIALGALKTFDDRLDNANNYKNNNGSYSSWIPIYGMGASQDAIDSIKLGGIAGTINPNWKTIGKVSILIANAMLSGKTTSSQVEVFLKSKGFNVFLEGTSNPKLIKDKNFVNTKAYRIPSIAITRNDVAKDNI